MFPKWNNFDKDIKDMEKVIKIPEIIFDQVKSAEREEEEMTIDKVYGITN